MVETSDLETQAAELVVMEQKTFKEPAEFTILSSEGYDKEIKVDKQKLNSVEEASNFYDKT
jgi:hypothetical protein